MPGRFPGSPFVPLPRALLASLLVITVLLGGCNQAEVVLPPPKADTLRIVSSFPRKGPLAHQSLQMANAIDMAIRDARALQPALKLEHIALDDSDSETGDWSRSKELENARAAADDPTVLAYVGPYNTGATAASLPVTSRAGLLQIGPTATWPGLTRGGWDAGEPDQYYAGPRNFVRIMPPDSSEALAAAQWAHGSHAGRILVVSDGSSYSDGLAAEFAAEAKRLGMAITARRAVAELTTSQIDADAAFYAPSTVSLAVRAAHLLAQAAPQLIVYAADTALADPFLEAGDAAQNWRVVHNGVDSLSAAPASEAFSRDYRDMYHESPGQYAANAYDATSLVLQAVRSGASDRTSVLARVRATRGYQGAAGLVDLDANGDNTAWRLTGYQVEGGAFTSTVVLSDTTGIKSR